MSRVSRTAGRRKQRAAIEDALAGLAEIGALEYTADRAGASIRVLDEGLLALARTGRPGELRAELERRQKAARSGG